MKIKFNRTTDQTSNKNAQLLNRQLGSWEKLSSRVSNPFFGPNLHLEQAPAAGLPQPKNARTSCMKRATWAAKVYSRNTRFCAASPMLRASSGCSSR